ncbi:MAG: hypothetical protein ACR2JM_07365, partial [Mycobacterium sp.]
MTADRVARRRPATGAVAGCVAASFFVFAGWLLFSHAGTRTVKVDTAVASVIVPGVAAVFAGLAARASAGRVRAAWMVMAAGLASATVGESIWAARDILQL